MARTSNRRQVLYFGRDESWLGFNRRVLQEAQDANNPLLERVKFLAITASNLDEFVEIRVAGELQRIEDGFKTPGPDGLTPEQSLDALVEDICTVLSATSTPAGTSNCCPRCISTESASCSGMSWTRRPAHYATDFYQREVDPLLTPITLDPAHPFPRVINKALCLALLLRRKRKRRRRADPGRASPSRAPCLAW